MLVEIRRKVDFTKYKTTLVKPAEKNRFKPAKNSFKNSYMVYDLFLAQDQNKSKRVKTR